MNLLIQDIFEDISLFGLLKTKCDAITRFIRDHHVVLDRLRELQPGFATLLNRCRALVLKVLTWRYTLHACLRSVLMSCVTLEKFMAERDLLKRYEVVLRSSQKRGIHAFLG